MTQRFLQLVSLTSFAFATLTACSYDGLDAEGDVDELDPAAEEMMSIGTAEQGLMACQNLDGTNSAMAALAVAAAQELGRWQASKDFMIGNNAGEIVVLASGSDTMGARGKSRCADGKCAKVQALLDMQLDASANKVYFQSSGSGRVLVNPQALRSRMVAKWREQRDYDARAKDGDATTPPVEQHKLSFVSAAKGGCDTNFTFKATTTAGGALKYPNQLKWKLAFADINNPYILFTNLGNGNLSIDPTYGLNEDGASTSGSCQAVCTKITTSNVAGQCCSCGGATKKLVKSAWNASTYLCQ
jgi:hypothetical protein